MFSHYYYFSCTNSNFTKKRIYEHILYIIIYVYTCLYIYMRLYIFLYICIFLYIYLYIYVYSYMKKFFTGDLEYKACSTRCLFFLLDRLRFNKLLITFPIAIGLNSDVFSSPRTLAFFPLH